MYDQARVHGFGCGGQDELPSCFNYVIQCCMLLSTPYFPPNNNILFVEFVATFTFDSSMVIYGGFRIDLRHRTEQAGARSCTFAHVNSNDVQTRGLVCIV